MRMSGWRFPRPSAGDTPALRVGFKSPIYDQAVGPESTTRRLVWGDHGWRLGRLQEAPLQLAWHLVALV